jgi:hypothetical protein
MIAAIYHWRIREGINEKDFMENWSKGTAYIHDHYGSLGAALHKASDGTFWSYARWPSKEKWQKMMDDSESGVKPYPNTPFVERIGEIITFEVIDDQLV